jgi:hypothetical protein
MPQVREQAGAAAASEAPDLRETTLKHLIFSLNEFENKFI